MQRAYNERVVEQKPESMRPETKRAEQRRRTQERILTAARQAFAQVGYDRATIRAIAAAANVNPGLVMHYFGSKEELFRRVAAAAPDTSDTETPEQLAEFLLGSLGVKLDGLPLASTAALRSMLTHQSAAQDVQARINRQLRELSDAIAADDPHLRATLIDSIILGIVIGRHLLQLDALRDAPPDKIIDLLRPCFQALTRMPE